mgnify:CR=1 FL=1
MKNKKEITQTEINNQIKKIRDFLFGFSDFITVMDIALLSLDKLENKDIVNMVLKSLLDKAENQCRLFDSNINEIKRLLK